MYKIIGADKKEYGPVTADQMHRWISEGRANAQTLVQAEGTTEWKPLGQVAEFADSLRLLIEPVVPVIPAPPTPATPEEILARDYDLDIISCISRGWALLKENMGALVGGYLIVLVLTIIAHYLLNFIMEQVAGDPLKHGTGVIIATGYLGILISAVVQAPLLGGFYLNILTLIRTGRPTAEGVFSGFQKNFAQLAIGFFAVAFLCGLFSIPFNIVFSERTTPIIQKFQGATQDQLTGLISQFFSAAGTTLPYFLIGLVPAIYIATSLLFTLPLIIDKNLTAGAAMKLSWRMVNKHWWLVFGLIILTGLVNVLGLCCCVIGLLFTLPIGYAAFMFAYETIFSGSKQQS